MAGLSDDFFSVFDATDDKEDEAHDPVPIKVEKVEPGESEPT